MNLNEFYSTRDPAANDPYEFVFHPAWTTESAVKTIPSKLFPSIDPYDIQHPVLLARGGHAMTYKVELIRRDCPGLVAVMKVFTCQFSLETRAEVAAYKLLFSQNVKGIVPELYAYRVWTRQQWRKCFPSIALDGLVGSARGKITTLFLEYIEDAEHISIENVTPLIAAKALTGMETLHKLGIWHRDIKHNNLLVVPATERVVWIDFSSCIAPAIGYEQWLDSELVAVIKLVYYEMVTIFLDLLTLKWRVTPRWRKVLAPFFRIAAHAEPVTPPSPRPFRHLVKDLAHPNAIDNQLHLVYTMFCIFEACRMMVMVPFHGSNLPSSQSSQTDIIMCFVIFVFFALRRIETFSYVGIRCCLAFVCVNLLWAARCVWQASTVSLSSVRAVVLSFCIFRLYCACKALAVLIRCLLCILITWDP